jgi:hypothetical protein
MRVNMSLIQRECASEFAVPLEELTGDCRFSLFVIPRHAAMYLARTLNGDSFPMIAHWFGCDHTSVMSGCRRTRQRMAEYPSFKERIERLSAHLRPTLEQRRGILECIPSPASRKEMVMRWWANSEIGPDEAQSLLAEYELEAA